MRKKLLFTILGIGFVINVNAQFTLIAELDSVGFTDIDWVDFNNDHAHDILQLGLDQSFAPTNFLYNGDLLGNFTETSFSTYGINQVQKGAAAWGDFDNDGDLDLFLGGGTTSSTATSTIYRNDLTGSTSSFVDIGASIEGLSFATGADWGDIDNDGDLDLLISGTNGGGGPLTQLYENQNGIFVLHTASVFEQLSGWVDNVRFVDSDNDGDLDISYIGLEDGGGTNKVREVKLYENNAGVFTDVMIGINHGGRGSIDWGDFDNDGDMDLITAGTAGGGNISTPTIYRNEGGNTFTNAGSIDTGTGTTIFAGKCNWVDYDNDGDLDIYFSSVKDYSGGFAGPVHNGFYTNDLSSNTSTAFTFDATTTADVKALGDGAFDFIDYDKDGDVDLVTNGHEGTGFSSITSLVYENTNPIVNVRPTPPTILDQEVYGDSVVFTWNRGGDVETHSNALSYNLIIGTSSYGHDIMSSCHHLSFTGMKIAKWGNVGNDTTWYIKGLDPGTYYWSVSSVDNAYVVSVQSTEGTFTISSAEVDNLESLSSFKLYPSPANREINIEFELTKAEKVNMYITNLLGETVKKLSSQELTGEFHKLTVETSNIPNGTYLFHIDGENQRKIEKFVIGK